MKRIFLLVMVLVILPIISFELSAKDCPDNFGIDSGVQTTIGWFPISAFEESSKIIYKINNGENLNLKNGSTIFADEIIRITKKVKKKNILQKDPPGY